MEKSYYFIIFKPQFFQLLALRLGQPESGRPEDYEVQRVLVAITQGGFGLDVIDDDEQVKQRFLEYLSAVEDIDLPRTSEAFDQYFELEPVDEFIDLDEPVQE